MDVGAWLRGLGLGQYEQAFRDNAVDAEVLRELTGDDLKDLGVSLVGHRRRLLAALAALREGAASPSTSSSRPELVPPAAPGPVARSPEAERRQLTVMFVDLVGSTALSSRLDPEEMRNVLRAYQNAVAGEVGRIEGYVAKFMGDGVLAYFGWPRAHEDEAERAVRAGLAIVAVVAKLSGGGQALACRVGIATGLVVVGDLIGEGAAREQVVVGDTPNLAARLQAVAEPGSVVIGELTRQLVGDLFALHSLKPQTCKGMPEPVSAHLVLRERALESRFAARRTGGVAPVVGRDQELALLLEHWRQAKGGEGQLVLLTGEAGIGKSRITEAMIEAVTGEPHSLIRYQCSPYHAGSALHPAIHHLAHTAGIDPDDDPERRLGRLEAWLARTDEPTATPEATALLAALLDLDATDR